MKRPNRRELLDKAEVFRSELAKLLLRAAAGGGGGGGEDVNGRRIVELDDAVADELQHEVEVPLKIARNTSVHYLGKCRSEFLRDLYAALTGGPKVNNATLRNVDELIFRAEQLRAT